MLRKMWSQDVEGNLCFTRQQEKLSRKKCRLNTNLKNGNSSRSEKRTKPRNEGVEMRLERKESLGCLRELPRLLSCFIMRSTCPSETSFPKRIKNTVKRPNADLNLHQLIHLSIQQILVLCPPCVNSLSRFRNTAVCKVYVLTTWLKR